MKDKHKILKRCLIVTIFLVIVSFLAFLFMDVMASEVEYIQVAPPEVASDFNFFAREDDVAVVVPQDFTYKTSTATLVTDAHGYDVSVVRMNPQDSVTIELEAPVSGYYHLAFDYLVDSSQMMNPQLGISVNGEIESYTSSRILVPVYWQDATTEFSQSAVGHDLIPSGVQVLSWMNAYARHDIGWESVPLKFYLEAGVNEVEITLNQGGIYLGRVYAISPHTLANYEAYLAAHRQVENQAGVFAHEAQHPIRKSSSFIRAFAVASPDVFPYDSRYLLLNTFGGASWAEAGERVTWEIYAPQSGMYQISVHMRLDLAGTSSFRTIEINGGIPFEEMRAYGFEATRRFSNHTLADARGNPYFFFLEAGRNEITMTVNTEPVMPIVHTLSELRSEIRELALDIRRLTGGQIDAHRDWNISEFIPDLDARFERWIQTLEDAISALEQVFTSYDESNAELELQLIINQLARLAEDPDELPMRMSEFSDGATSVAQMMGQIEQDLQFHPLELSRIFVHGVDDELPAANATALRHMQSGFAQFFATFNQNSIAIDEDQVIDVWVNRSQWQVEVLQHLTETVFTPETGISVRFSVMPNEQKLILANAAGEQPDLALGVGNWLPYQMALRGAAADLTGFDDFSEVISEFAPGAFLPLMMDEGLFGIPETQDFYVLFYRTDILDSLGISVPDTWDEVTQILPELQRQGLNFFVPLSGPDANKPFMFTAPFFYQFGGDVHTPDALGTGINSEESLQALRFMTDLYSVYSLPLQVANFYNDFRYGTMPIGISNFETYLRLTVAAPEIAGAWDIALHPGVASVDGRVARWATGSATSAMILEASQNHDAAWEFLRWWSSSETQTLYSSQLMTLFGPEFIWNTANLEAFNALAIPEEHRSVILEQWTYLREVPLTPASYIIEREISNTWNRVVFDGEHLRSAVDGAVIRIEREIRRRMIEFDYIDVHGNVLKPYVLPTIERVEEWMNGE